MQYNQAVKRKPTRQQLSQATNTGGPTDEPNTDPEVYDPWNTIKMFKMTNKTPIRSESTNSCINQVLNRLEQDLMSLTEHNTHNKRDNATKAKRQTLKSLAENTQIVTNKADNSSTIVVLNRGDYIEDGLKHLDALMVYKQLRSV
jgi:hypothetical protein